jgi:hypothetical protein
MVRSHAFVLAVGLLVGSTVEASAWTAANGMTVTSDGARSFVVAPRGGMSNSTDYWCAAGDFAVRRLGLRPSTRLFRMTPGSGSKGVRFSLDEQGSVPSGVTVFGSKDSGLSASLAQVYCTSLRKTDVFDR